MTLDLAAAYEAHSGQVWRYCASRVGPDAADDIAQQVWVEAWERRHGYTDRGWPVTAWLLRIAQSRCVDHLRRQQRRPTVPLEGWDRAAPDALGLAETLADLAPLLDRCTARQRQALALRAQGYELAEIGRMLGGSTKGAAVALLHRARDRMRLRQTG